MTDLAFRNPRTLSIEGLVFEHEMIKIRGQELRERNDESDEFMAGLIRRCALRDEFDRREFERRMRPSLKTAKRRLV